MLVVFVTDNADAPSKDAVIGFVVVRLAVPLQSPEIVKFADSPALTESLNALLNGKSSVEVTLPEKDGGGVSVIEECVVGGEVDVA
jgi:hypothetical protein